MSPLARKLGFAALVFYGIGDVLGAGIYALVGKVVEEAGIGAWLSFASAGVVAGLTGLSYAEMSSRVPVSAGAAAFVKSAFPGRLIATVTGVLILGTGLSSAATVTTAFSGYLRELLSIPDLVAQILLLCALSILSFWGILHSSRVNIVLTIIEFSGLFLVICLGLFFFNVQDGGRFIEANRNGLEWKSVVSGMTIAYFAFVGFEDLCNLADEAKKPERDIPRAILIALAVATILYLLVTLTLQIHFQQERIIHSKTPLLLIFEKANWDWIVRYFSVVAILAIANTGLANLIMASRLLYGMSEERLLPSWIGSVHRTRKTPWVGILIAFVIALFLVLTGSVKHLAQTTSLLVLTVFCLVHMSLIRVKLRKEPHDGTRFPFIIPVLGGAACLFLLFQFSWQVFLRALIFVGLGIIVWAWQRKNSRAH